MNPALLGFQSEKAEDFSEAPSSGVGVVLQDVDVIVERGCSSTSAPADGILGAQSCISAVAPPPSPQFLLFRVPDAREPGIPRESSRLLRILGLLFLRKMSSPASGFKRCKRCQKTMSVTDPHRRCLWCLGVDHPVDDCDKCQAMKPKTRRERRAKLAAGPPETASGRGKSSSRTGSASSRPRSSEAREAAKTRGVEPAPLRRSRPSPSRSPPGPLRRTREESRGRRPRASGDHRRSSPSPSRSRTRAPRASGSSFSSTASRRHRSRSPRRRAPTPVRTEGRSTPRIASGGSGSRPPSRSGPPQAPTPSVDEEWKRQFTDLMRRLPPSMMSMMGPTPREIELPTPTSVPSSLPPATSVSGQSKDLHHSLSVVEVAGTGSTPAGPHVARASTSVSSEVTLVEPVPGCTSARPGARPTARPTSTAPSRLAGPGSGRTLSVPSRPGEPLDVDPGSEGEEEYQDEPRFRGPIDALHGRLAYASGLDTSPESDLTDLETGFYPDQCTGYWHVIKMAAETLGITLPVPEKTKHVLTEILDIPEAREAAAIPFSSALSEPLLELWEHPTSLSAVPPKASRKYKPHGGDPAFVREHPTPDSLVVQAATVTSNVTTFPNLPPDRDSKRFEGFAKKVYASCSLGLRSLNSTCTIIRYIHELFKDLQTAAGILPEPSRDALTYLANEGLEAAKQAMTCGLDTSDAVGRSMATAISMRRHAWIRTSQFAGDVQSRLMDMPFNGKHLFGERADEALLKFSASHKTARDFWPEPAPKRFVSQRGRPWYRRPQVQAAKQQQAKKQFPLPSRGRGRGRGKGLRRAASKEVTPSPQQQS